MYEERHKEKGFSVGNLSKHTSYVYINTLPILLIAHTASILHL